eukprot:1388427-Amorphochlora_amoeboformis.AAC.2
MEQATPQSSLVRIPHPKYTETLKYGKYVRIFTHQSGSTPKNEGSSSKKNESDAKELKNHKENVNTNADEEASIRLALELMRQESWEMHRIMQVATPPPPSSTTQKGNLSSSIYPQHETLLAVQDQRREKMNRGEDQGSSAMNEDHRLALALAEEEARLDERINAGEYDDVDIDELSHEQLVELGNRNGDVKKEQWKEIADKVSGDVMSLKTVNSLPTEHFNEDGKRKGEKCLVCQCEYEKGEVLKILPCGHAFHNGCISHWLLDHPQCPLCKRDIVQEEPSSSN